MRDVIGLPGGRVHEIGHPDPDDLVFLRRRLGEDRYRRYALDIHGCDGCCAPPRPSNYVEQVVSALAAKLPGEPVELLRMYALLVFVGGEEINEEDVHNAWALWRSVSMPGHISIVPFPALGPEVQATDRPFMDVIHEVSRELGF